VQAQKQRAPAASKASIDDLNKHLFPPNAISLLEHFAIPQGPLATGPHPIGLVATYFSAVVLPCTETGSAHLISRLILAHPSLEEPAFCPTPSPRLPLPFPNAASVHSSPLSHSAS
jgi:hypothetical protein